MTGRVERFRDDVADREFDKRLLALLLLLLLVVLGAGYGTFAFDGGGEPGGNASTPTPTPVELTPVSPTPTPTPESDSPTATPTTVDTETPTETRRDDRGDVAPPDPPETTASPTASPTESPRETERPNGGGGGGGNPTADLRVDGSTVFGQVSAVAPGDSGEGTVVFENAGDVSGALAVSDVTVTDHENSLLEPEVTAGDDATTGELSSALRVRLSITDGGGEREFLFGSRSGYVPLAELDGEEAASADILASGQRATVTVAWKLPAATGNEVQSDGATFDVEFTLRQTTE